MKKRIIIGTFFLLILITVISIIVGPIVSYNYSINNYANDKFGYFDTILILVVGGFIIFYELDLFYTVYYFLVKPKTITKSILNIFSNLTLLIIFFTDTIAHFLFSYVSEVFGEEIIVLFALLILYIILRILCVLVPFTQSSE